MAASTGTLYNILFICIQSLSKHITKHTTIGSGIIFKGRLMPVYHPQTVSTPPSDARTHTHRRNSNCFIYAAWCNHNMININCLFVFSWTNKLSAHTGNNDRHIILSKLYVHNKMIILLIFHSLHLQLI